MLKRALIRFTLLLFPRIIYLTASTSAQGITYKKTNQGVVLQLSPTKNGSRVIRLEVISDKIIRVAASWRKGYLRLYGYQKSSSSVV